MRLAPYADYALTVLIHVALRNGELVRINDVAAGFGVPRHHLSKVVHKLGAKGYLLTILGRNGGLRVARRAAEISLAEALRDFEPDLRLVEHFDTSVTACRIQPTCVLVGELDAALAAFLGRFDGVSLNDLVRPRRALQAQLGLPEIRASGPARRRLRAGNRP